MMLHNRKSLAARLGCADKTLGAQICSQRCWPAWLPVLNYRTNRVGTAVGNAGRNGYRP